MTREWIHAAGRVLTRVLLHPRWRRRGPMTWCYLRLYLLGKRLTERHEVAAIRRLLVPGMVVADVGANVGFYTLFMAACVGPTGRVLAFEPDPFCFQLLRDRIHRSGAANVEAYQAALGERAADAVLYSSAYNRADNRLHPSHTEPHVERHDVQIRALDAFRSTGGLPPINAIKIDVQGAEASVLRGAQHTIEAALEWIWIEFSPPHLRGAGTDPREFLNLLASLKMDLFEVDTAGHLRRLDDADEYIRRIGSAYGDLVLKARPTPQRGGLGRAEAFE